MRSNAYAVPVRLGKQEQHLAIKRGGGEQMKEKVAKIMQWLYEHILKGITAPDREPPPISPDQLREELKYYE